MKVLHLALDEKFIPFVRDVFETAFPRRNRFRITAGRHGLRFVSEDAHTQVVGPRYWLGRGLREDLAWCDCLLVHYMTPWATRAIARAPDSTLVYWSAWGGDYASLLPSFARTLYLPSTQAILERLRMRERPASPVGERVLRAVLDNVVRQWDARQAGRIDVLSTVVPAEQVLLEQAIPGLRARYLPLPYGTADRLFAPGPEAVNGADILVGNSADPTNNHADAFQLLARFKLESRRIVVPLSYGGAPDYVEQVCHLGQHLFGERFAPLRGFLPLEEYNRVLAACPVVVMNQVRQQGVGSMNTCLYKGAKVFLRPCNPALSFYRSLGVTVFELEASALSAERLLAPLPEADARSNRAALKSYYSYERAVAAARALIPLVAAKRAAAQAAA